MFDLVNKAIFYWLEIRRGSLWHRARCLVSSKTTLAYMHVMRCTACCVATCVVPRGAVATHPVWTNLIAHFTVKIFILKFYFAIQINLHVATLPRISTVNFAKQNTFYIVKWSRDLHLKGIDFRNKKFRCESGFWQCWMPVLCCISSSSSSSFIRSGSRETKWTLKAWHETTWMMEAVTSR